MNNMPSASNLQITNMRVWFLMGHRVFFPNAHLRGPVLRLSRSRLRPETGLCPVASGDCGEQVVGGPHVEKLLQELGSQGTPPSPLPSPPPSLPHPALPTHPPPPLPSAWPWLKPHAATCIPWEPWAARTGPWTRLYAGTNVPTRRTEAATWPLRAVLTQFNELRFRLVKFRFLRLVSSLLQ